MPSIPDAIGTFFEQRLMAAIPDLKDYRDCENTPDFQWNSLWIEAKVAFKASDYGILPKLYQMALHNKFSPMIYACGYHDFAQSMKKLTQTTHQGRIRHLHRKATIDSMYFLSSSVVERIWSQDMRTSVKASVPYCPISSSDLRRIITNTHTKGRAHYGLEDCAFKLADPIGHILTEYDATLVNKLLATVAVESLVKHRV